MKIGQTVLDEAQMKKPGSIVSGSVYNDRANIGISKFVVISSGTLVWKAQFKEFQKIISEGWRVAEDYNQIMEAGTAASGGKFNKKKLLPDDLFVSAVAGGLMFSHELTGVMKSTTGLTEEECAAVADAVTKKANALGYAGKVEPRWEARP